MKQKFIYNEQYHDYLRLLGEAGGAYVISEPDGYETYWDKTEYKDDDPFDHFLPYCIEDENNNSRWVTPYQLYILNY